VSEIRSLVCLKVAKLFQEPGNLDNYPKNILIRRMIMHRESLNCLVVLNDRIKTFFFQLLPISTQVILIVGIKHEQEILNV
jgi:hypothetical protein